MRCNLVKDYLLPTRIVEKSDNIVNAEALLVNRRDHISFTENNCLICQGKGYIILDFGRELQGGIRVLSHYVRFQKFETDFRIRFGESCGEVCAEIGEKNATNHHSTRDMIVKVPELSDMEWGQTGFRFVRIDFLSPDHIIWRIPNIYAAYSHRDLEYKSQFICDDSLVNQIYDTARYTVFLTMQKSLIEGIKRDRLIWIGDMEPQVLAITNIFGADECVEDALRKAYEEKPLPGWMHMPTYSFWFIQIIIDYYLKVRNTAFVEEWLPKMEGIIEQLDSCVCDDGTIDFSLRPEIKPLDPFFLDWPTYDKPYARAGCRYVFIFVTKNFIGLLRKFGKSTANCEKLVKKLEAYKEDLTDAAKQVVAFGYLAGQVDSETAAEKLLEGGAKGLCTFHSYFILRAIAETAGVEKAVKIMKEYYGGMLSRGATTFWEDFNVEWLKGSGRIDEPTPKGLKDLHGDFGDYCYKGFIHSFCHGWSCGPVQFLTEYVLGLNVLESGCRKIAIKPNMAGLNSLQAKFPTPYGVISANVCVENGETKMHVDAPSEVQIVY